MAQKGGEMNFTDDDLERLKERVKQYGVDPGIDVCNYIDNPWELEALVSRLEAAEEVAKMAEHNERGIWFADAIKKWHKAAGK